MKKDKIKKDKIKKDKIKKLFIPQLTNNLQKKMSFRSKDQVLSLKNGTLRR